MKVRKIGALLLCAAMLLTLCACGKSEQLTEGAKIEDKQLTVYLEGNPATGYTWTVSGSGDSSLGEMGGYEFITDSKGSEALGVGGMFKFTFAAMQDGTQTLHFVYERTFEENSATRAYDVTARVSGKEISIISQGEAAISQPTPSAEPTPTPTPSVSPSPTPTPSASPTPTAAPTATPAATPVPTPVQPLPSPYMPSPMPTAASDVVSTSGVVVEFGFSLHILTDNGVDLYLTPKEGSMPDGYYPQAGDHVAFSYNAATETLVSLQLIN